MTHRSKTALGLMTQLAILGVSATALATPMYPRDSADADGDYNGSGERCLFNNQDVNNATGIDSATPVYIFIEKDMWKEWNDSFPTSADGDGVTKANIKSAVLDAAEVWNRESMFRPFVWGGFVTDRSSDTTADVCTNIRNELPAGHYGMYVRFRPHGSPPDSDGNPTSAEASLNGWGSCDNVLRVTVYGFNNTVQGNEQDDAPPTGQKNQSTRDFTVDGRYVDRQGGQAKSFRAVMVHELGHIRLAHRHAFGGSTDPNPNESVMSYGQGASTEEHRGIEDMHLWPWDKDCIDDPSDVNGDSIYELGNTRWLQARFQELTSDGELFGQRREPGYVHAKGGRHAGTFGDSAGLPRYARYRGDAILRSTALVDETATNFPTTIDLTFSSAGPDLLDLYVSPSLFAIYDSTAVSYENRIAFVARHDDPALVVDPPALLWGSSSGWFGTGATNAVDPIQDAAAAPLAGHISPVGAYDPIHDDVVVAHVPTTRIASTDSGRIGIALGINPNNAVQLGTALQYLDAVVPQTGIPAYSADGVANSKWSYDIKTQTQPGIACADVWLGDTNCLIAWKDIGSPDGHILYTNVGFNAAGNLVHTGVVQRLARGTGVDARTAGDVSVAFFENRFYVAYKTWGGEAVYHRTPASLAGSPQFEATRTVVSDPNAFVVDAPSWQYVADADGYPAMLNWTVDASTL